MKKLALAPETLAVESFATIAGGGTRAGTVRARDDAYGSADYNTQCCSVERPTCAGQATCLTSCNAGGPCTCPLP
jgi:hypothetical protein